MPFIPFNRKKTHQHIIPNEIMQNTHDQNLHFSNQSTSKAPITVQSTKPPFPVQFASTQHGCWRRFSTSTVPTASRPTSEEQRSVLPGCGGVFRPGRWLRGPTWALATCSSLGGAGSVRPDCGGAYLGLVAVASGLGSAMVGPRIWGGGVVWLGSPMLKKPVEWSGLNNGSVVLDGRHQSGLARALATFFDLGSADSV
jgi:hypothetical protein